MYPELENSCHVLQRAYYQGDTTAFQKLFFICYSIMRMKLMHFIKIHRLDFDFDLGDKASEGTLNVFERYTDPVKRKKRFDKTGDSCYRIQDFNKIFEYEAKKQLFGEGDKRYVRNRQTIISMDGKLDLFEAKESSPPVDALVELEDWLQQEKTVVVVLMRHKSFVAAVRRIEKLKGRKWCYDNAVALHRNWLLLHPEQEKRKEGKKYE